MDIYNIERAAEIIFALCRNHPELCPHDYGWVWSKNLDDGKQESHYECRICGHETVITK